MAWRIDEQVVRGEIDNRTRGRVSGSIWFFGRDEPVVLDLAGNAWHDVAGRRLEFTNPEPKPGLPAGLATVQSGSIGDCTASRKVRVPDIPLEQVGEYFARREKFPWHWGNSLYLEWFSQANGRVVIETASFQLRIVGEPAWEMTSAEEEKQRAANTAAMSEFMDQLTGSVEATETAPEFPGEIPGAEHPQSEEEAEAMMADSDKLGDRIRNRMEREGPDADFEKILDEELERRRAERGQPPPTPEEEAERAQWIDEANRAAEEAADDPELNAIDDREHPLSLRASELAVRVWRDAKERGWIPEHAQREHPVAELTEAVECASGKLAGALNGREWPPEVGLCGLAIVWLKRARGYLADAQTAAEVCAENSLTGPEWLAACRTEIDALADETDALIAQCREILERGFD